jgi:hypothetical protein
LPAHRNKPGRHLFRKWGVGPERQLIWVWREYCRTTEACDVLELLLKQGTTNLKD